MAIPEEELRGVPWGVALRHLVESQRGGTKGVVDAITVETDGLFGSRSSFMTLYKAGGPRSLTVRDIHRAWLLIAAAGDDPQAWGVPDDRLPKMLYRERKAVVKRIRDRIAASGEGVTMRYPRRSGRAAA